MGYVEQHIERDEQVVYRANLHPIFFAKAALVALVGVLAIVGGMGAKSGAFELIGLILLVPLGIAVFDYRGAEFAVTTKRVIVKHGIIQRKALEVLIQKVEGIKVDQDIVGRMLGYGTIYVHGTGGTHEPAKFIDAPMEFRRHVNAQISARDKSSRSPAATSSSPVLAPAIERVERECPHCAEPILAKAKICKHCGRDSEAVPAA